MIQFDLRICFKWVGWDHQLGYIPENGRVDTQNDGLEKVDSFVAILGMLDFRGITPSVFFWGDKREKLGIGGSKRGMSSSLGVPRLCPNPSFNKEVLVDILCKNCCQSAVYFDRSLIISTKLHFTNNKGLS